jgi:hypothetical protein
MEFSTSLDFIVVGHNIILLKVSGCDNMFVIKMKPVSLLVVFLLLYFLDNSLVAGNTATVKR